MTVVRIIVDQMTHTKIDIGAKTIGHITPTSRITDMKKHEKAVPTSRASEGLHSRCYTVRMVLVGVDSVRQYVNLLGTHAFVDEPLRRPLPTSGVRVGGWV